jgi:hypothetical protein
MNKIIKRSDKVAFYGIKSGENVTYKRMTGFTDMSISKNPKEYTRQYIDEDFEQSDVVGFSPAISFTFDSYLDNDIHKDIADISELELVGGNAIREIIIVDKNREKENGFYAIKRTFSVIVDTEGASKDAYQISGTFKVKGEKIFGIADSTDDWETCTFSETI